jgi:hypothetical protein
MSPRLEWGYSVKNKHEEEKYKENEFKKSAKKL